MSTDTPPPTVMIVEGDQKIRGEIHRTLEARGFRVISAWDAQDVLGFLNTHADPIDGAVVDASMIDGKLLDILREKRPGIHILVTSAGEQPELPGYEIILRPFQVLDVVDRLMPLRQAT